MDSLPGGGIMKLQDQDCPLFNLQIYYTVLSLHLDCMFMASAVHCRAMFPVRYQELSPPPPIARLTIPERL